MADTTALKNRIRAAIKANDNQEITGPVLQQSLLDIVDELNGATEIEASARQNADNILQQNITAEKNRAEGVESTLQQNITAEKNRAEGVESTLQQNIDKILLKRSVTPPSSAAFCAFANVLNGKKGYIRILNVSTCVLYNGGTAQGVNFVDEDWHYYDFSALQNATFYTIAKDTSKDVKLEFLDEDSIFNFKYAVLECFGDYLIPGYINSSRTFVLSNNSSNFMLKGFPVKQGWNFQYLGRAHWHAIYLVNMSGEIVNINDSSIDARNEAYNFTIPEDGYLYAWSTEGSNFIMLKDDIHKDFNYNIVDLLVNKLEVAKKFENLFDDLCVAKKPYYGNNHQYSFTRGTSGYFRVTWYYDLAIVKNQIDLLGEFVVYIEILCSIENAGVNGSIYAIGDALKYSPSFMEVDGVYTTGLVKIRCTQADYDKAIQYGQSKFSIFWQGGGSDTHAACTYTIKQLYQKLFLDDAYSSLDKKKADVGLHLSDTPPSSAAFWAFINALDNKKAYIRVKNASTCQLYYNFTSNPTNIYVQDGKWHLIDCLDKVNTEFYTIAANPNEDVIAEIFDTAFFPDSFLEDYEAIAIVNEMQNINFIDKLPYLFNRGTSGYPRKYWYFDLDEVKFQIDHYGFFDIFMEITSSPYRSAANGAFCLDGGDILKYNVAFTEVDGVYTTGLVNIRVNSNDYNTIVSHGKTRLGLFWQYGASSYEDCEYTINQAYYAISKLFYSEKQSKKIGGTEKTFEIAFRGYSAMTPIDVKKDGSGDFTSIQEAINSITDASVLKQYVINVYDDFNVNDLTELWNVNTPTIRNTSAAPSESIALVILKDWIHLRGIGSPKRLYVESPNVDMAGSCFQNIQTIYPKGNCSIDNFYVGIKGGRYAIHQEAGGGTSQPDYHATTYYRNLVIEHKGNYMYTNGASWTSTMAQANGTAAGLKVIYENVKWISDCNIPFYTHTNLQDGSRGYDEPNEVTFINCSMVTNKNVSLSSFNPYWGDIGSDKTAHIKMIGCNFQKFSAGLGGSRGLETTVLKKDVESGGAMVTGNSNAPMVVFINSYSSCLSFKTAEVGRNIDVIGGSAYDLIWGATIRKFNGTADSLGRVVGKRFFGDAQGWASSTPSQVYTLAHLIGNCANNPKTLVVKIDNSEYTIVLNKNYVTTDGSSYSPTTVPAYSNAQVIADINNQFSELFSCDNSYLEIYSFDDCQEIAVNRTEETIEVGDAVCHDYANGFNAWRLAASSEKAEGIAGCRINPSTNGYDSVGNIILADKAILKNDLIGIPANAAVGSTFILGSGRRKNWYQGTSNNATFVVISSGYCKYIK